MHGAMSLNFVGTTYINVPETPNNIFHAALCMQTEHVTAYKAAV